MTLSSTPSRSGWACWGPRWEHAVRLLILCCAAAPFCAAQQPFPGEPASPQSSQPQQQAQPFPGEPPSQQQNPPPQQQKQSQPFTPQDFPPDPNAEMPTFA